MLRKTLMILLVSLEAFYGVFCEETYENSSDFGVNQPTDEYLQVFRNVPTLFEFLIGSLQERPEILENDDITIFRQDDNGVHKRSIEESEISKKIYMDKEDEDHMYENEQIIKREFPKKYTRRIKRDFDVTDGEEFIDNNYLKKDGNFLSLSGLNLRLSSDEVEKQALKVEQILEDYNRSKRN